MTAVLLTLAPLPDTVPLALLAEVGPDPVHGALCNLNPVCKKPHSLDTARWVGRARVPCFR